MGFFPCYFKLFFFNLKTNNWNEPSWFIFQKHVFTCGFHTFNTKKWQLQKLENTCRSIIIEELLNHFYAFCGGARLLWWNDMDGNQICQVWSEALLWCDARQHRLALTMEECFGVGSSNKSGIFCLDGSARDDSSIDDLRSHVQVNWCCM